MEVGFDSNKTLKVKQRDIHAGMEGNLTAVIRKDK
jgi:hypothetical protein